MSALKASALPWLHSSVYSTRRSNRLCCLGDTLTAFPSSPAGAGLRHAHSLSDMLMTSNDCLFVDTEEVTEQYLSDCGPFLYSLP